MISERCFKDSMQFVRQRLASLGIMASDLQVKYPFRDRYSHTLRVLGWAVRLASLEGGDTDVVKMAAIFHDVSKGYVSPERHAADGAEVASSYLSAMGLPREFISRVASAVRHHSSKGCDTWPLSLEDKILIDADWLDEVGATTVLWDAMAVAICGNASYQMARDRVRQSLTKLRASAELLATASGRLLFAQRVAVLESICRELDYELEAADTRESNLTR